MLRFELFSLPLTSPAPPITGRLLKLSVEEILRRSYSLDADDPRIADVLSRLP